LRIFTKKNHNGGRRRTKSPDVDLIKRSTGQPLKNWTSPFTLEMQGGAIRELFCQEFPLENKSENQPTRRRKELGLLEGNPRKLPPRTARRKRQGKGDGDGGVGHSSNKNLDDHDVESDQGSVIGQWGGGRRCDRLSGRQTVSTGRDVLGTRLEAASHSKEDHSCKIGKFAECTNYG